MGILIELVNIISWVAVVVAVCAAVAAAVTLADKRRHLRDRDTRIIAQAKALGVWDKRPIVLGGRALELKAWEDFKIKRKPGETDAHLRRRCMALADEELANTPRC